MARDNSVAFKVNDDELKLINKSAKDLGMKRSEFLRLAINGQVSKMKVHKYTRVEWSFIKEDFDKGIQILAKTFTKLNHVSSEWEHTAENVNQIAHKLNALGYADEKNLIHNEHGVNDMIKSENRDIKPLDKELTKIWQSLNVPTR